VLITFPRSSRGSSFTVGLHRETPAGAFALCFTAGSATRAGISTCHADAALGVLQLVVVAIPEELFFRGYPERLEHVWPPTRRRSARRWAGVNCAERCSRSERAVIPNPQRLAVFSGAAVRLDARPYRLIAAGALYHA
jgi:hypothetical protein